MREDRPCGRRGARSALPRCGCRARYPAEWVLFVPPGPDALANGRPAPIPRRAGSALAGSGLRTAIRPTGVRGLASAVPAARVTSPRQRRSPMVPSSERLAPGPVRSACSSGLPWLGRQCLGYPGKSASAPAASSDTRWRARKEGGKRCALAPPGPCFRLESAAQITDLVLRVKWKVPAQLSGACFRSRVDSTMPSWMKPIGRTSIARFFSSPRIRW